MAKVLGDCEAGLTCFALLLVLLKLPAPQYTSKLLHVTRMIRFVASPRPCLGTVIPHLPLCVILRQQTILLHPGEEVAGKAPLLFISILGLLLGGLGEGIQMQAFLSP